MRLTKMPFETRSYILTPDDDKEVNRTEWRDMRSWLDANAPGWSVNGGILTLPKIIPAIETYFMLKYG